MSSKKAKIKTADKDLVQTDVTSGDVQAKQNRNLFYILTAGLMVGCLVVYFRVFWFDFVLIDDDSYVTNNPFIENGLNLASTVWAWTSVHSSNWHPLTWMSHALDISFFGMNAGGHHAVNLLLHTANTVLLFYLLNKISGAVWKSAVVAAIFALHPAHVESVAWVSERKDVLSTLFWLLSTLAYVRYVRDASSKKYLWISVLLFGLGLSSKPMLVTMPFTLLLLDLWPLGRLKQFGVAEIKPLLFEKLPYFALSAISVAVTIFAQGSQGAIQSTQTISIADRLANAVTAYVQYVVMLFYPANLAVWYPFNSDISIAAVAGSLLFLIVISAVCIWQFRERRYLFVGWFWFIGTLVPVIGIVQVGRQAMADRYTYVPYIGLSIIVVWFAAELFEKLGLHKKIVAAAAVIVLTALSIVAYNQVSYWKNTESLFDRTLSVTDGNYFIEHNYCYYLYKKGRLEKAIEYCNAAIKHDPELATAYTTLGSIKLQQKAFDEAEINFAKAKELAPDSSRNYANLALVAAGKGDIEQAAAYIEDGKKNDKDGFFSNPETAELYAQLGLAAAQSEKHKAAAEFYKQASELKPNDGEITRSFALALSRSGERASGIKVLEEAVKKGNTTALMHNSLGIMYAEAGRQQDAVQQFQRALQIDPGFAPARNNLQQSQGR